MQSVIKTTDEKQSSMECQDSNETIGSPIQPITEQQHIKLDHSYGSVREIVIASTDEKLSSDVTEAPAVPPEVSSSESPSLLKKPTIKAAVPPAVVSSCPAGADSSAPSTTSITKAATASAIIMKAIRKVQQNQTGSFPLLQQALPQAKCINERKEKKRMVVPSLKMLLSMGIIYSGQALSVQTEVGANEEEHSHMFVNFFNYFLQEGVKYAIVNPEGKVIDEKGQLYITPNSWCSHLKGVAKMTRTAAFKLVKNFLDMKLDK